MTKEEAIRKGLYAATEWDLYTKIKGRSNCTFYIPTNLVLADKVLLAEIKAKNITLDYVKSIREAKKEEIYQTLMAIFDTFPKIDNYQLLRNYIFTLDGILEIFFENYFENVEGSSCCCDKASFTICKIKQAIEKGTNLELQEKYDDEDRIAYWCPKTIKNTDQAINLFYRTITFSNRGIIKEEEK